MITGNFSGGDMKNRNKNSLAVCFFLAGAVVILTIGYQIYRQPYYEAERRNNGAYPNVTLPTIRLL